MKTNRILLTAIGITLISFSASVYAQNRPTDILASPKHREMIVKKAPAQSPSSAVVKEKSAVACPQCKEQRITRVDWTARGQLKPTRVIVRHLCDGCSTKRELRGVGKNSTWVTTHSCDYQAEANRACCVNRS